MHWSSDGHATLDHLANIRGYILVVSELLVYFSLVLQCRLSQEQTAWSLLGYSQFLKGGLSDGIALVCGGGFSLGRHQVWREAVILG